LLLEKKIMSATKRVDYTMEFTAPPKTTNDVGAIVENIGASVEEFGDGIIHKSRFTFDAMPVTVGNTTGVSFGGTKFYDFPLGRILVLGSVLTNVAFGLSNAGNATPIDAADGGDVAVGTTAPSDGTLTGTDVDLIPSTSIDPLSGGISIAALAAAAQFDGSGTAKDAYFNILIDDADVGDGASDIIEVSGTLEITWILLGAI